MLEICNLSVFIGKSPVLQNINCTLACPSLTCIIGPNGAGKTTLLKSISGLHSYTGSLFWDKKNFRALTRKEQSQIIAFVPQSPMFHFPFTVTETIAMGLFAQTGASQMDHFACDILERLHLSHLRHRLITEISTGERQKVLIARGLAARSPVLLLDEPTASLDPQQKVDIWNLIKEISKEKATLVATHDIEHTEGKILALRNGAEYSLDGPPSDKIRSLFN